MALHNRSHPLAADLADQITHPLANHASQGCTTVFRGPNHMQVNFKHGVSASSIGFHAVDCTTTPWNFSLKPSPKGEGFDPPRRGQ